MLENQRGITLIQMVITIVMLILIAGFAILNSSDTIIETKVAKVYNEMVVVKEAVLGNQVLGTYQMSAMGTALSDLSSYPQLVGYESGDHEYYFLNFVESGDVIGEMLEIRNVENNYIVNVKNTQNIEILLVNGIKISDKYYYSDDEIIEQYNEIFGGR